MYVCERQTDRQTDKLSERGRHGEREYKSNKDERNKIIVTDGQRQKTDNQTE